MVPHLDPSHRPVPHATADRCTCGHAWAAHEYGQGCICGCWLRPNGRDQAPTVEEMVRANARHAGRHTHQWHRFVITAPDFLTAGRVAAGLGWWLHCWDWEHGPALAVGENPAPEGGWVVDPWDERQARVDELMDVVLGDDAY